MGEKIGNYTFKITKPATIISTGTVAGPLEGDGPLGRYFDRIYGDTMVGTTSFEKAEKEMMLNACYTCINKTKVNLSEIDHFISGDLMNQITTSGYSALELKRPFIGIYGACSSAALGLALGTMLIDGGFGKYILVATSSHNSSAERQFRYPTEYGLYRKKTSQSTVTGAGAALLASGGQGPRITYITLGKVLDFAVKDSGNLGAAMAPGLADTVSNHFTDTGFSPNDYDLILSGDLGEYGHQLAREVAKRKGGFNLSDNFMDCGVLIYDSNRQDVHAGGSGCAASALVTFGYIYNRLKEGELKKVLLVATGALHSPTSLQQGGNIPGIAHAISIEA